MVVALSVVLIFLAALFSGLNLGLMSLDTFELRRKAELGDHAAAKVLRIRERGNLLLVTLLTGNVAVISALSIVLDSVFHGLLAGVLTTVLITIFGEILPQAILARYALSIGAYLADVVRVIMIILWPVCAPVAWVLDRILGEELPTLYTKNELSRLLEEHRNQPGTDIDQDEVRIARGALSFGDRKIRQIMTPRSVAYMLPDDTILDAAQIEKIKTSGFSRVPVFKDDAPDDVVGILYVKDLVGVEPASVSAGQLARPKVYHVNTEDTLDDTLNAFLRNRSHLFIVIDTDRTVQGIVTIEDVLEEIIDREIADEFDRHDDMRKVARGLKRPMASKRSQR